MTRPCDLLHRYVDGELEPAEAEGFALHLDGCETCPAALHEALQLVALEAATRAEASAAAAAARPEPEAPAQREPEVAAPREPEAPAPIPITRARAARSSGKRTLWIAAAAVAAAAAAVIFLVVRPGGGGRGRGSDAGAIALATAPTRSLEGRLSHRGAAAHRPYSVGRAGDPARPAEPISLEVMARLEQRGDHHGVAAAHLLLGDPARALSAFQRAGEGPDVASDRALALLASGKPADALVVLDEVLERAPDHAPARWNRALALRDLELPLSAAEAFEAAAASGEPGWSDEARRRAAELEATVRERREAFFQLHRDGARLASEPEAVTPEIARRFPGSARLYFYDAVRGAETADAVRRLAPLARELDAAAGGDHLARYLERTLAADLARRRPLAARYARLVAGERLDAAAGRAFVDELRAAGQDDLVLGAIIRASADGVTAPEPLLPELRRLADASGDPWFELLASEQEARPLAARGDRARAEAVLRRALATCDRVRHDFRCARLELQLAEVYLDLNRLAEARRLVLSAWARARRGGEWYVEQRVFGFLANLESLSGELGARTLAVARAYSGELTRRSTRCIDRSFGHHVLAMMRVNRQDLAGARRELARADEAARGCPEARPTAAKLFIQAHVLRDPSATPAELAAFRAELAALRPQVSPGQQAVLDQAEGRAIIDRDRAAGIALLERAIATARAAAEDVEGRKARGYAYAVLVLDAARAGEWDRVWRLLGEEAGFAPAARCAAGVAAEDGRAAVVVRDAAGATHGRFAAGRSPAELARELEGALAGCPKVEVVARAPVYGEPALLGTDLAWSYRSGRTAPAPAPLAGARLVISNTEPPPELGLPRLLPWRSSAGAARELAGPSATPSRALAELASAGYVEVHVHGTMTSAVADGSFLMMSPEADGRYTLTAEAIRGASLRGRPVVVLAACHAAKAAPFHHRAWSLPASFVEAGARAVIASTDVIDDADAGAFFDQLRGELERGADPAIALRDVRRRWLAAHPAASWVRSLMVFE